MLNLILSDPSQSLLELQHLNQKQIEDLYVDAINTQDHNSVEQFILWLKHVSLEHPDIIDDYVHAKNKVMRRGVSYLVCQMSQHQVSDKIFNYVLSSTNSWFEHIKPQLEAYAISVACAGGDVKVLQTLYKKLNPSQKVLDNGLNQTPLCHGETIEWLLPHNSQMAATLYFENIMLVGAKNLAEKVFPYVDPSLNGSKSLRNLARSQDWSKKDQLNWIHRLLPFSDPSSHQSDVLYQLLLNKSYKAAQLFLPHINSARCLYPVAKNGKLSWVKNILSYDIKDLPDHLLKAASHALENDHLDVFKCLFPKIDADYKKINLLYLVLEDPQDLKKNEILEFIFNDFILNKNERLYVVPSKIQENYDKAYDFYRSLKEKRELDGATEKLALSSARRLRL